MMLARSQRKNENDTPIGDRNIPVGALVNKEKRDELFISTTKSVLKTTLNCSHFPKTIDTEWLKYRCHMTRNQKQHKETHG